MVHIDIFPCAVMSHPLRPILFHHIACWQLDIHFYFGLTQELFEAKVNISEHIIHRLGKRCWLATTSHSFLFSASSCQFAPLKSLFWVRLASPKDLDFRANVLFTKRFSGRL